MRTVGRFAVAPKFDVINRFFSDTTLAAGTYDKNFLATRYDLKQLFWSMQQYNYADGTNDLGARVYLWNSMAFSINDNARFVVKSNGTKELTDFSIEAFSFNKNGVKSYEDNFDLASDDLAAILGNSQLKGLIDPSHIGRKVNLLFNNDQVAKTYTQTNYEADKNLISTWSSGLPNLYSSVKAVTDQMFADGVTDFRVDEKPIWWDGDHLDDVRASYLQSSDYLKDKTNNGVVLIGGKGNDRLIGGSNNDSLMGGNEHDSMFGGAGSDTLDGGEGNDVLEGGSDADTLDGGTGNDTLSGGFDNGDTYILSSGTDAINDSGAGDKIKGYAGEAVEQGEDTGIYRLHGAQLQNVGGDLIITRGADVTYVWGWVDGDYGITLEEKDKPDDVQTVHQKIAANDNLSLDRELQICRICA